MQILRLRSPQNKAVATSSATSPAAVTQDPPEQGHRPDDLWGTYGGSYNEQRFSPLTKINDTNVKQLGLAFYADYDTNQNQHGSPLYADGVIYVSTSRNFLHAFDAQERQAPVDLCPGAGAAQNLGNVNKGIAMWNGKIYMGTLDGRLVAIDAKTGKPAWEADTIPAGPGRRRESHQVLGVAWRRAPRRARYSSALPAVSSASRGFIAAYDAETGKEVWRFWTVPGDPAKGYEAAPSRSILAVAAATWRDRSTGSTPVVAAPCGMRWFMTR